MKYAFERLDLTSNDWSVKFKALESGTVYQAPAWLAVLSATQKGEPVVAVLKDGGSEIGYFTGMIIRKAGLRILGSPFPGGPPTIWGWYFLSALTDVLQCVL